jgi:predicted aspartyl protease
MTFIRSTAVLAGALALCIRFSPAAHAATTCVPARLASSGYPVVVVQARVNDTGPYRFLVDTGATVTIVNASLAKRLHLAALPVSVQGVGAGGRFSTRASTASIAVGGARQDRVLVATFDLTDIENAVGAVDGAIGYNFLKAYRVTLDYPGSKLCLEGG